ncbi:MAG: PAS domain S-box protein [Algoriphagus sp.]|uniref:PAS domain S-box protein n=1 Tax=Algoriphagus sp. TaxID=1872435 RepID=UPI0026275E8C|nr:PAS domain S-box protein [Algoriphagus sp.]MDG1279207.1 PAS domain S-box protein [Algoriphagus sp.]
MADLNQFDISSFFDELQDPVFLIDSDEIIYKNKYFHSNFQDISDSWREWFTNLKLQGVLNDFFEKGDRPKIFTIKSLIDNRGDFIQYEWNFTILPSSFQSRFLIVKGRKVKFFTEGQNEDCFEDSGFNLGEELRYIQSILNNSHDLISILDKDGNYNFISSAVAEKLGFPAEAIIGKNYKDFIERGIIEIVKGDFKEILVQNREVNIDFWINKQDGSRIYLECYAKNLLNHPQIQGVIFSARDITEYVLTDLSLQKRFEIENLINQISSLLINAPILNIEILFKDSIARFGEFLHANKCEVYIYNKDFKSFDLLSNWNSLAKNANASTDFFLLGKVKLILDILKEGKVKLIENENSSSLCVPMISGSKLLGFIALDLKSVSSNEDEFQIFRQLGDLLGGAYRGSQMTKKIERNESLLANTELLSKSGSWTYSTSKKVFFMSGGLSSIFGYGEKPSVREFTSLIKKLEKPGRTAFVQNLKKAIEEEGKTSGEFIVLNDEGKQVFISYEIEARRDFLTQGLEVYGFCTDISHKRASEDYLKLQSQILAQVADPIIVTDTSLNVIYLNEAAVQLCCPETAEGYRGQISELVTLKLNSELDLNSIVQDLKIGTVWKQEGKIRTRHTAQTPFEITIQAFTSASNEKIGFSFIYRNLTEKYESEKLSKRVQLIVENSPAVIFRVNPERAYEILYISENINQFGFNAIDLIKSKVSFLDLLHPEDSARINQFISENPNENGISSFSGEYRVKKPDGTYAWVEDKTRDVFDENGKIIYHEGLFQDITDRKNLEIFKEERDKQYRVLASNIPGTNIFLLDKTRKYILAEGTNFDHWGMKREDFEGKYLSEISLTNLVELNQLLDRVYHDREIVDTEFFFKGRYFHRTIRPIIENGEVEFALSIIRDINEEFQAKENLLRSEEKYRTLVEESTEIIFSLSDTFEIEYVSPNISQFLGYVSEEVLGQSIFEYLNSEDLDVFQNMLGHNKNILDEYQFLEFRLRHKNGEYKVFSSNGRMIESKNGSKRSYTGIARDISKLKEAQKELLMAKERAEQASLVKSQFLSVMSHEIRTPMNAVIGLSHFLMEEDPRPDQLENLRTLQFSAENLMGLINDILDFNKIDSGKLELERVSFDLRNVINRILHSHSFQANEKSLKITSEIDGQIPQELIGDPVRVGQIVNNLISNAIKFTDKGFVSIQLQLEKRQSGKASILFRFIDSGIGIPEDKSESIFEAFTQASSSTTRKYGGTGLGLAIVKRLVEIHGGEIKLKSKPNEGSTFEFTLEFETTEDKAKLLKNEKSMSPKSLQEASILVAEDNAVNQILLKKFLTKWNTGNLVLTSDGGEALEEFEKGDFNLVLLDLQMPVLDGFSVARAIRSHKDPNKSNIPILVLTATTLQEIKGEMEEIGINDFVPKPFTPEDLYEKLSQYLPTKNS